MKTARIVWASWAALTLVAVAYACTHGRRLPYTDDWDTLVPVLTGRQHATLSWLWSQQNEHRLPILRLGQLVSVKLAHDFRAPIVLGILVMAAAAAALLVGLRTWRGHHVLADVCVPLLLLRLNNSSFGWGGQLHFVASTALSLVVLRAGAGWALLLLPLCGANGIALAGPFAIVLGVGSLRRGDRAGLAWCIATLSLIALVFVGWQRTVHAWPDPTIAQTLAMTCRYLGAAANPSFAAVWPLDAMITLAWLAIVVIVLRARWRRDRPAWLPRLALFLALQLLLALVVGRARGGRGWLPDLGYNYASLALGVVAGLVVATLLAPQRLAHVAMFALLAIPYAITTPIAFASTEVGLRATEERALLFELRTTDPATLATRYHDLLQPSPDAERNGDVAAGLAWMHRAR